MTNLSQLPARATDVLTTDTPFYHDAYALRRAASTMTSVAVDALLARLSGLAIAPDGTPQPLRILSLGCGDGDVDLPLLNALHHTRPVNYVGVDVNERSLAVFREKLLADPVETPNLSVVLQVGDLADVTDAQRFDVILLSHVLYYVADPSALAARLVHTMLRTDGRLIIVHSAYDGIPSLMDMTGLPPFLTAEQIAAGLTRAGEPFTVTTVTTELDVTDIIDDTPNGATLLSFLLERDVSTLTADQHGEIRAEILRRAYLRDTRRFLPETLGLIELAQDLAPQLVADTPLQTTETVADYTLLAAHFDWAERLRVGTSAPDGRRAILDVGCGTGRWLAALQAASPDLAADRHTRTYTAVDPANGAAVAASSVAARFCEPVATHQLTLQDLPAARIGEYDLIWAVHSLYALTPDATDTAVMTLVNLLRPGGVAVVVLADQSSFYVQASEQALGTRLFIGAETIRDALTRQSINHRVYRLCYHEEIAAKNDGALHNYVWHESIGNSFAPAGGGTTEERPDLHGEPWFAAYRHGDTYRFPQNVNIITIRRASTA